MDDQGKQPRSKRRWLLRVFLGLASLVLVLRLGWGWWVSWRLDAHYRALRARGEPVSAEDLDRNALPDPENAWLVQLRAGGTATPVSPRHSNVEFDEYPPYPATWIAMARQSEQANARFFTTIRPARRFPRARIRPVGAPLMPKTAGWTYLNSAKAMASTLADGAAYKEYTGDHAEAVERLLDLMHLARSLRQDETIVSQLVAAGIEAMACNQAMASAPALDLAGAGATRPATRAGVQSLLEVLLNEQPVREGLRRSMAGERIVYAEVALEESSRMWVLRPLGGHAILRANEYFAIIEKAAAQGSWPEAEQTLARWQESALVQPATAGSPPVLRYSRWYERYMTYPAAVLNRHSRVLAERRAAALSLACQLFRADHDRWPARLEELVPAYIASVPEDPFKAGQPFGYQLIAHGLPAGGDRPVVFYEYDWDVGPPRTPAYGWIVPRAGSGRPGIRQYRDLARWHINSKKAVQDNPQKPDAPGERTEKENGPAQP